MKFERRIPAPIAGISSVVLALLIGVGVWYQFAAQRVPSKAARTATEIKANHGGARASVAAAGAVWAQGTKRTYSVELSTTFGSEKSAEQSLLTIDLKARLALLSERAGAYPVRVHGELQNVALRAANDTETQEIKEDTPTGRGLTEIFHVLITADGHVDALEFSQRLDPLAENLIKSIVAAMQLVRPDPMQPEPNEWSANEVDISGAYRANYRRVEDGVYEKVKGSYSRIRLREAMKFGAETDVSIDSKARFSLSTSGALESIEASERVRAKLGDASFQSDTAMKLTRVAEELVSARPCPSMSLALTTLDAPATGGPLVDGAGTVDETVETILARLGTLDPKSSENERRTDRAKLVQSIASNPEAAFLAARQLRRGLRKEDERLVLGALADSGTPAAQSAMLELAREKQLDPELRHSVLTHFNLMDQPTAEAAGGLREIATDPDAPEEIRSSATLALGSASGTLEKSGNAENVDHLLQSYSQAKTDEERALFLNALGNGGSSKIHDTIRQALTSPSPLVRASAVDALRFVKDPWATELLVSVLHTDPVDMVRRTAVRAAAHRSLSPLLHEALVHALKNDQADSVRVEAVGLIGRRNPPFENAVAFLDWAVKNDVDEDVRRAAKEALELLKTRG